MSGGERSRPPRGEGYLPVCTTAGRKIGETPRRRLRKEVGLTAGGRRPPPSKRKEVSRRLAESFCARDRYRMAETAEPWLGKHRSCGARRARSGFGRTRPC